MHRLFIDQNVRIEVAEALRGAGHVATHASEVGLSERDDAAIFRWANEKDLALSRSMRILRNEPSGTVRLIPASFACNWSLRLPGTWCQFSGIFWLHARLNRCAMPS